jgi:transposase-like protein
LPNETESPKPVAKRPGPGAGRAPKETILAYVELLEAGTDPKLLAEETGYSTDTLEKWRRKYGKNAQPAKRPKGLLAAAKKGAGIGAAEATEVGAPGSKSADTAPAPAPVPKVMVPSAQELVAIIEGIDGVVIKTIAAVRNKHVPPQQFMELARLPREDREQLLSLAPYAAEYVPEVMQYFRPAMAVCFVLVWGISVAGRVKHLAQMDEKLAREAFNRANPPVTTSPEGQTVLG